MAQDPELLDEEPEKGSLDTSHDLDMVPLYFSQTVEAESEAEVLRSLLESNDIPATLSGDPAIYPNLGFLVYVPRNRLEDARRIIAEQQAAGPEAAAEAEAESERP
jgi:Putative prokaryotic signal transducing protein